MKTIVVDDEESALEVFRYEARGIDELDIVYMSSDSEAALEYVGKNKADLAILDVDMQSMDGISLGNAILQKVPDIILIYITGYEKYAIDAVKLHAEGFILKPYTANDLRYAVESAKLLSRRGKKKIFARTFGHFDLFVDNKPIMFKSAKAKELLALLIDRQGGTVTTDQVIGTLWEDRPNDISTQNLCSKICKTLEKELNENGVGYMLVAARGVRHLDTDKFECDLYKMLEGNKKAADKYIGEYMVEYSWAESRTALLDRYAGELY